MTLLKLGMCPALNEVLLKTFREQKINTDVISSDAEELARKCSISYKVLLSIRKVLFAQYAAIPVSGANIYQEVISSVAILQTGCQSIDNLLDGGLYTCELVEVTGSARSGKTQFCLTVASNVAIQSMQGVLYIDTTGGFSPRRVAEILEQRGCSQQVKREALQRIQCRRVFDIFELLGILEEMRGRLEQGQEAHASVRMVIVDSVSALLAPLLGGNQIDGQALIGHLSQALKVFPVEYYTSVLVTNTVVQGDTFDERKPALGRSWLGVPHTRMMLKNGPADCRAGFELAQPERRRAVVVKSQRQPTGISVPFMITERGITDT